MMDQYEGPKEAAREHTPQSEAMDALDEVVRYMAGVAERVSQRLAPVCVAREVTPEDKPLNAVPVSRSPRVAEMYALVERVQGIAWTLEDILQRCEI